MESKQQKQDIRAKLLEPFDPFDIEWRVQQAGQQANGKRWALVLAYVTNRAIMERLDDVFGIDGWQNEFQYMPDGGIVCGISARLAGEWVTKYDGADKTQIEATKGGLSGAMKRAGVQWGIGRYLYDLESTFVTLLDKDQKEQGYDYLTAIVDKQKFWYDRPSLPKFALPKEVTDDTDNE